MYTDLITHEINGLVKDYSISIDNALGKLQLAFTIKMYNQQALKSYSYVTFF